MRKSLLKGLLQQKSQITGFSVQKILKGKAKRKDIRSCKLGGILR
ncbi:MAG: hypothetical protein WBH83_01675 [Methanosarcina flavescens]